MKSSMSIWRYVANVKSTVKILSTFVAFLENMNFNPSSNDDKRGFFSLSTNSAISAKDMMDLDSTL